MTTRKRKPLSFRRARQDVGAFEGARAAAAQPAARPLLAMTCLWAALNVAKAAELDDAAARFFRTHPNEIDATEKAGGVLFANRQVGLEFRKSKTGFELARLYGVAEQRDFLTAPKAGAPRRLLEIRMALDPKRVAKDERAVAKETRIATVLERMAEMGQAFVIDPQAGKIASWRHEKQGEESTLHLEWKGIDVKEEKGALDAEVTVRLRAGDDFYIECASLFVEGAQVGRIRLRPRSGVLSLQDPSQREMIDFLGRIVGYYKQEAGKKFLAYGRLMRPLAFSTPSAMPMLNYGGADSGSPADTGAWAGKGASRQFPVLMSGVFRAEDGEVGVFVVNAGAAGLAFAAPFDLAAYGMAPDASVEVAAITPEGGTSRLTPEAKGVVLLQGALPGRGVTLFRLKAAPRR